jgi:hypothetical protein
VTENAVEIEFSEYVDRRTAEEAIFISPPVGNLEFDWSGTEVTILFEDTLRRNTTYVLTIGTDVVDKRAGNRMASGYTLAFSTGDSIDRGLISGKVFDQKPEGIMVFAYALQGIDPDTLDPGRRKPDYVMQTGKDGMFAISNVAWGTYRLFAVRDEYRNLLYDTQVDEYGVARNDITLSDQVPRVGQVWFRMAREDTTSPFLTEVEPLGPSLLRLRFSEPIDSFSFEGATVTLTDTLTGADQQIAGLYLEGPKSTLGSLVTIAPLDSGAAYRLTVEGVLDTAGNAIQPRDASALVFPTAAVDTTPPLVSLQTVADTSIGYSLSRPIELRFSEPVDSVPVRGGLALIRDNSDQIEAQLRWLNPARLLIQPMNPSLTGGVLELSITMDSIRDVSGNTYRDSVLVVSIPLFDPKKMGEAVGRVVDESDEGKGSVQITAESVGRSWRKSVSIQEPGPFRIDGLPEGRYRFSAFRDADESQVYSPGLPFPFKPSERFIVGSDTVKIRARWAVEGILLTIP